MDTTLYITNKFTSLFCSYDLNFEQTHVFEYSLKRVVSVPFDEMPSIFPCQCAFAIGGSYQLWRVDIIGRHSIECSNMAIKMLEFGYQRWTTLLLPQIVLPTANSFLCRCTKRACFWSVILSSPLTFHMCPDHGISFVTHPQPIFTFNPFKGIYLSKNGVITSLWSLLEGPQAAKVKMGLLAGTAAATAIGGAALYVAFRPKKHPNVPNLNVPESALLGHMPFIEEGYKNKCLHEDFYDAFVKTKSLTVNLSLPVHQCSLVTTDPDIIRFVFDTEFESFEKSAIQRERWYQVLGI
ncbi:hypothetical protein RFI_05483 [Reticulomyxa filosa]|uniref:Uncharacterized protein n=1 Tax=Reticulomyxa filosa TaxID=46433 RepID=X6P254_RETFI|nr:hypothetical protein RFI_05483 [Reticulomyxa filosa]|eukprot:ETO31637.1 hypothetical protein RFI_05483 [Reticulomyxa filosa]